MIFEIVPLMGCVMVHLHVLVNFRIEHDICGCQIIRLDTRGVTQSKGPVSQRPAKWFPNTVRALVRGFAQQPVKWNRKCLLYDLIAEIRRVFLCRIAVDLQEGGYGVLGSRIFTGIRSHSHMGLLSYEFNGEEVTDQYERRSMAE